MLANIGMDVPSHGSVINVTAISGMNMGRIRCVNSGFGVPIREKAKK